MQHTTADSFFVCFGYVRLAAYYCGVDVECIRFWRGLYGGILRRVQMFRPIVYCKFLNKNWKKKLPELTTPNFSCTHVACCIIPKRNSTGTTTKPYDEGETRSKLTPKSSVSQVTLKKTHHQEQDFYNKNIEKKRRALLIEKIVQHQSHSVFTRYSLGLDQKSMPTRVK